MPRTLKRKADALPAMTEKELAKHIIAAAKECGWLVYHTFLSIHSSAGFPDLILAKDGRVLAWELKSDKGKVLPAQQAWLDALAQVPGIEARVIRPADMETAYKILLEGSPAELGGEVIKHNTP